MKSIKVSEGVHDELELRKYKDDTFNDVLKRELGLVPETVQELTDRLPERLATATNRIVEDHITGIADLKKVGYSTETELSIQYISPESEKSIFDILVYLPTGNERENYQVDIRYRNHQNEMERIIQFTDAVSRAVKIRDIKDPETHERTNNTRTGDAPGETTAEDFGEDVAKFVQKALREWHE
ncbi:MAG: hypothetical protein U5K37_06340 [Natrialbaceae archaeon]|nr:hypothetical protein [Natrialbaceae archaeon]